MNPLKLAGRFRKALKDPERKPLHSIIAEYTRFKLSQPDVAEQYFYKRLYRKSVQNPMDYILTYKLEERIWHFNDMNYFSITIQKHNTELFFSKHNLPIVKSFAYNTNTLFFMDDDFIQIHNTSDFLDFLKTTKEKGLWQGEHIIIKPKEHSWGGKGIYKLNLEQLLADRNLLETVFKEVIENGFLFQRVVIQHPELNRVNPNSLNTIRVDTFVNNQGKAHILCARLRTSANTSFLDNISSGGLFVGIDLETGLMHPEGFTDFNKFAGTPFRKHPQTGLVFDGFKVPFFEQVKELATQAAALLPRAKVMAWDIAIQPEGPIIIEGNYFPGLLNSEIVVKGFRNNPVFREILSELNGNKALNGSEQSQNKLA